MHTIHVWTNIYIHICVHTHEHVHAYERTRHSVPKERNKWNSATRIDCAMRIVTSLVMDSENRFSFHNRNFPQQKLPPTHGHKNDDENKQVNEMLRQSDKVKEWKWAGISSAGRQFLSFRYDVTLTCSNRHRLHVSICFCRQNIDVWPIRFELVWRKWRWRWTFDNLSITRTHDVKYLWSSDNKWIQGNESRQGSVRFPLEFVISSSSRRPVHVEHTQHVHTDTFNLTFTCIPVYTCVHSSHNGTRKYNTFKCPHS